MAELTSSGIQTVAAGQNVPLISTAACGKPCIVHREGSGLVTLRGLTQQCKAKFRVSFGANIAVPTGGTVGAITDALAMGAIVENYSSKESAVLAFNAGADILLMPYDYAAAFNGILSAVQTGEISLDRLNESVERILRLKAEFGII